MRLARVRLAREDLKIFVPGTDRFLSSGRKVDIESPYWAGHLADGSIVEIDEAAADLPLDPAASDTPRKHKG